MEIAANIARYHFEVFNLAPETFQVAHFSGTEEMVRPYRFELDLVSTDPSVDFASVINQPATFTMQRGLAALPVHGIVSHFEQADRTAQHVAYRAVLVPRLQQLALNFQSRVFQDLTVIEIITRLLEKDASIAHADFRFELADESVYKPRPYCVQFQETDLAFMHRLLEFEGIAYFFEQDEEVGKEIIVFTDNQSAFRPIPEQSEVLYRPRAGLVRHGIETVHRLTCSEQVVTGKVLLKDYNYEAPDVDLKAESHLNQAMPGIRYEYGSHFGDIDEGERLARVRNEEIEAQRRVLQGESDCIGFRSGSQFTLTSHFRADLNENYLITRVAHEGDQRRAMGLLNTVGGDGEAEFALYTNTFTCIPASASYRPPRHTPIPRVPGVMTARIESREEDPVYAFLDAEGRYKARAHFDLRDTEEAPQGDASKPLRMKQPYAGQNYGLHCPNHAETEMVLSCVNGDPDRPMALGTVPNANNPSPVTATNRSQSVIRTAGKNELTFDDAKGQENIYMHATKNHTVRVTSNESISVGYDQTISVGNNQNIRVEGHRFVDVATGNDVLLVQKDRFVDVVEGNDELRVETGHRLVNVLTGNDTLTVAGDHRVDVLTGNDVLLVQKGNRVVNVTEGSDVLRVETGHHIVDVKAGNEMLTVSSGHRTVRVLAGDDSLQITSGNIERLAPAGKVTVLGAAGITFVCGASVIEMKPDEINIISPMVKINC